MRSAFIEQCIDIAKANPRTIVLPEGADVRVLEAAVQITAEKISKVVVLGDESKINAFFTEKGADVSDITVIDPKTSPLLKEYANQFYEMRKARGMTEEKALETIQQVNYFGMMMMFNNVADGLVSGAAHSTGDTVRPALKSLKAQKRRNGFISIFYDLRRHTFHFLIAAWSKILTQISLLKLQFGAETAKQFNIPANVAIFLFNKRFSEKSAC